MNAFSSQGTPISGSTLTSGVTRAPAKAANPAATPKVTKRTSSILIPEALGQPFVHDNGARGQAQPRALHNRRNKDANDPCNDEEG